MQNQQVMPDQPPTISNGNFGLTAGSQITTEYIKKIVSSRHVKIIKQANTLLAKAAARRGFYLFVSENISDFLVRPMNDLMEAEFITIDQAHTRYPDVARALAGTPITSTGDTVESYSPDTSFVYIIMINSVPAGLPFNCVFSPQLVLGDPTHN